MSDTNHSSAGETLAAEAKPARQLRGAAWLVAAIGPGIVVAGSVMGGGELINTPLQAATFGFVLLWAILFACLIKYFLQVEIGRHCLIHRRTTIQALNTVPGPRFRDTGWVGIVFMFGYTVSMLVLVGIVQSLGGLMHAALPLMEDEVWSSRLWSYVWLLLTQVLLWRGIYGSLEKVVTVLVGIFSFAVLIGLGLVQGTEFAFGMSDVMSGLTFSFGDEPKLAAYAVVSLVGGLGTTANELFMYPYWILEKGYADRLGDRHSPGWKERANEWIRGLHLDTGFATLVATIVTAAFFLLGAAILHRQGIQPEGLAVVKQISGVFTETYGPWSQNMFLFGGFCVLFSTLVVVTAATGRMWGDLLSSMGYVNRHDATSLRRVHRITQTILLIGFAVVPLVLATMGFGSQPAQLVVFGQFFVGAFSTPLLMLGIVWIAFHTDREARMSRPMAVMLLASVTVILICVFYGLYLRFFLTSDA